MTVVDLAFINQVLLVDFNSSRTPPWSSLVRVGTYEKYIIVFGICGICVFGICPDMFGTSKILKNIYLRSGLGTMAHVNKILVTWSVWNVVTRAGLGASPYSSLKRVKEERNQLMILKN